MKFNKQSGVAQLIVVAVMAFLALGIPLTTKLVQQNQENRSNAASSRVSCASQADVDNANKRCVNGKRGICKKNGGGSYYWSEVKCARGCNPAGTDCNPKDSITASKPAQQNQDNRSNAASSRVSCASQADVDNANRRCVNGKRGICKKNGNGSYYWSEVKCANGCKPDGSDCNPKDSITTSKPAQQNQDDGGIKGVCGSKDNQGVNSFPTGGSACKSGKIKYLKGGKKLSFGYYVWACVGKDGDEVLCSAYNINPNKPIPGICGSKDGQVIDSLPVGTDACKYGSLEYYSDKAVNGLYRWTCNGTKDADSVNCNAQKKDYKR